MIKVQGVSKVVSDANGSEIRVLDGIDLEINQGEIVAIVGPSGSGKTTLMSVMAGLDDFDSGEITLLDQPLSIMDEDQRAALRRASIGFVFQNFQLIDGMTALENVQMPLIIAGQTDAAARGEKILVDLGLGERLHHGVSKLSGGEQQRVAIGRAFAVQPRVLFADEPTGNLDAATGEAIIKLLFTLRKEQGATLILVTHDPALAARCDRRFSMVAGRLEAEA